MAFCPQCSKQMEQSALACPHCGYDFSPRKSANDEDSPALDVVKISLGFVFVGLAGLLLYMAYEFRSTLNGLIPK